MRPKPERVIARQIAEYLSSLNGVGREAAQAGGGRG